MSGASYGALLDAVRGVQWPARRVVPAGPVGAHHSRMRGASTEFAEYRAYRQGDEARRIDWRLLARSDRAYVRLTTDRAVLGTTIARRNTMKHDHNRFANADDCSSHAMNEAPPKMMPVPNA